MREEWGEYPVFLLDDVLSEWDFSRRSSFLEIIGGKVQTLLTTTDVGNFRQDKLDHYREYGIVDGRLVGEEVRTMFVYLGKDTVIRASSIIAIINWEAVEGQRTTICFSRKPRRRS